MQIIKYIMLFLIFISANLIGKIIAKKYTDRLQELEEMKNALNIFKSKIKFTYQPIPEIFEEISNNSNRNISNIFKSSRENMENLSAEEAWIKAIEESKNNLTKEDKNTLKMLSKLLGQTDVNGQISQIEIT